MPTPIPLEERDPRILTRDEAVELLLRQQVYPVIVEEGESMLTFACRRSVRLSAPGSRMKSMFANLLVSSGSAWMMTREMVMLPLDQTSRSVVSQRLLSSRTEQAMGERRRGRDFSRWLCVRTHSDLAMTWIKVKLACAIPPYVLGRVSGYGM